MKTKIFKAFTLIELLIVIVIIGILATALIPRITGAQTKARYARVEKDLRDLRAIALLAQSNTQKNLGQIVGNYGGYNYCGSWDLSNDPDLRFIQPNDTCRLMRIQALRRIEAAAAVDTGTLSALEVDPWGSPYISDFNEGEGGSNDCRNDVIYSVGPNGRAAGVNWNNVDLATGDNKGINIAPMGCPGAY